MQVFTIIQGTTALIKDLLFHCGGRPARIEGYTFGVGAWWQADGMASPQVLPGGTGNVGTTQDLCRITDYGFNLLSSTTYVRVNSGVIVVKAIMPGLTTEPVEARVLDLSDSSVVLGEGDTVWTGGADSFDYDASGALEWVRKEA